jgi:chromosome segregation ATPase
VTANVKAEQASSEAQNANRKTAEIEQRLSERVEALNAFKKASEALQTKFDGAQIVREIAHGKLRDDNIARFDELEKHTGHYNATVSKIWKQLGAVQGVGAELRKEFDATVNTNIEPNRDFFGLLGTVIMVVSQLQLVVESLNKNRSVAPLKLDWHCYLPTLGQPETNGEPSNSKGKDKSRQ